MASSDFYAKGTIRIKNADENVVPFYPKTKTDCVFDCTTGKELSTIISEMSAGADAAANSGGVKIIDGVTEEVQDSSFDIYSNETLGIYLVPEIWSFTVNTEAKTEGETRSAIPFHFSNVYNATVTLTVDWGDGTTSNFGKGYGGSTSEQVHIYSQPGTYTINITSTDWSNTEMYAYYDYNSTSTKSFFADTLISIDKKLPLVKNTSFSMLFCNCSSLQSIPSGLFDKNTTVTTFDSCFYNCSSLQSIPSGLFDKNTVTTNFNYCFDSCSSLQSIPAGLFDKNTAVTTFQYCFWNCTSLQSIPSGLFDNNTAATEFNSCFRHCSSLQSIPAGLFDKNTVTTNFNFCFYQCTSLQSIPAGLFDKNTAVTRFNNCFEDCSSLQSIPAGLFDKNTAVTNFGECFYNCTSLQSIPSGLFDKNTEVTSFQGCFSGCTSIQFIPSGLFDKNTAVTNFYGCFSRCSSLTDFTLHISSKIVSNCTSFVTKKAGTTRTVYVPSGSTTRTKFNNVASSLGLTIIGE